MIGGIPAAPLLVLLAASVTGLALTGVHSWHDHGWRPFARQCPVRPPHVHWWEHLPRNSQRALTGSMWAGCLALASLFLLVPWIGAAVAWAAVLGAAALQFRPHRHPAPAEDPYVAEVRRAVGRGAPSALLGTPDRGLRRHLSALAAARSHHHEE